MRVQSMHFKRISRGSSQDSLLILRSTDIWTLILSYHPGRYPLHSVYGSLCRTVIRCLPPGAFRFAHALGGRIAVIPGFPRTRMEASLFRPRSGVTWERSGVSLSSRSLVPGSRSGTVTRSGQPILFRSLSGPAPCNHGASPTPHPQISQWSVVWASCCQSLVIAMGDRSA